MSKLEIRQVWSVKSHITQHSDPGFHHSCDNPKNGSTSDVHHRYKTVFS